MKKVLMALAVMSCGTALCFAQTGSGMEKPTNAMKKVEASVASGKIVAITVPDATKGLKGELTIADSSGAKQVFTLDGATVLTAADGKAMTAAMLKVNDAVKVHFAAGQNASHKALMISVLK